MKEKRAYELSDELKAKIEKVLAEWNSPDSEARKRFESSQAYWDDKLRPLIEIIEDTERLSAREYMIYFNVM